MLQRYRPLKCLASWLVVALLLPVVSTAFAESDFGGNWEAKPLVDRSVPKPVANTQAQKPVTPLQPDLEAKLKPAEPFIHDVETRLFINPKPGTSLVKRLDTLQTVLFGELKYQDAQELLSKLAEIFPQEAAKAQAGLHQQLLNSQPLTSSNSGKPNTYSITPTKPAVVHPPSNANLTQAAQPQSQYTPSYQSASQPMPQSSVKKKKKHFWQDDWESDFENDPFFNDSLSNRSIQNQQQGPSKLSSVGQGLAGLAMMAGGVAGNYYLNKKLGNNTLPNNQQYYNNYPYYSNYGYPYGYGYAVPYGYGSPYANGYIPPAGAYGSPYGGIITSRPYQTYGTSTFGGVSPLGVPTGF